MKFQYLILTLCGLTGAIPTSSLSRDSPNHELFKYDQIINSLSPTTTSSTTTTTLEPEISQSTVLSLSTSRNVMTFTSDFISPSVLTTESPTKATTPPYSRVEKPEVEIDNVGNESSASLIYTLQKESSSPRESKIHPHFKHLTKHHNYQVFDFRCPKQHLIHPCDCLELDKRLETMEEGDEEGSGDDSSSNATLMIEDPEPHPDHIETVAFCKNIPNLQVLSEAVRGFQGHRLNYFVLDGCKLPPFPNNLFHGIHIVWMEIMNSTMQFHDNFWSSNAKSCP